MENGRLFSISILGWRNGTVQREKITDAGKLSMMPLSDI